MKRLMPVLLTIGIALTTAACGVGKGSENTPQPTPSVSITPMSAMQQAVAKAPDAIDSALDIKGRRDVRTFLVDDRRGGGSYEWVLSINGAPATLYVDLTYADPAEWDGQAKIGKSVQIAGVEALILANSANPTIWIKRTVGGVAYLVSFRITGTAKYTTEEALTKAGTAIATCLNQA